MANPKRPSKLVLLIKICQKIFIDYYTLPNYNCASLTEMKAAKESSSSASIFLIQIKLNI